MRRLFNPPREKRGISELTATVLTMAVTLVAGFSVFGYINYAQNLPYEGTIYT